jgi:hypothetical protein
MSNDNDRVTIGEWVVEGTDSAQGVAWREGAE